MPLTNNLGYPRIGVLRELKFANESYWAKKSNVETLISVGQKVREDNWKIQRDSGIDIIPSNDFSFYDHVLDHILTFGCIPQRYSALENSDNIFDLYFAMARGFQNDGVDVIAMEMTKWFDSNYHYIVPEFIKDQKFFLKSEKVINEFKEAKELGILTKPVLLGPITFLLLGKEKESGFDRIDLIDQLLPVYVEILKKLSSLGCEYIQLDEPFLNLDLNDKARSLYQTVYQQLRSASNGIKLVVATYFDSLRENSKLALSLPIDVLHIDLVRGYEQLDDVLNNVPENIIVSLGIVDGRNIWKNDFVKSLETIKKSVQKLGDHRVWISPSCSLLHTPYDLDIEDKEDTLPIAIKSWLSFSKQKLVELADLSSIVKGDIIDEAVQSRYKENIEAQENRRTSTLIHNAEVKNRVHSITDEFTKRKSAFSVRKVKQQTLFNLPPFPTTTIGSFPQTREVRKWRADFKAKKITQEEYDAFLSTEIEKSIRFQEELDIDVLVHGEFERNDMVEYFGEQLKGYVFTKNGWVQSYGSRCVKPPIIFGDVLRAKEMTVKWSSYAQSLTNRKVKGMLTGPVTMLQWSFVRDDQARSETCFQIALAILDEVRDLEKAGVKIIQIDEPAIREGLPLRKEDQSKYLDWAVQSFRVASSLVEDDTQIHTHMCYSEFNDIIEHIANMDADVITIETSRSQMELLDAFSNFNYPNDIGPGVFDIHSPRVPSKEEILRLLEKALNVVNRNQVWVNPDCGLKTRGWEETKASLREMIEATKIVRQKLIQ